MTQSRPELEKRFADLDDAELLRRHGSGGLTEMAMDVAHAELERRGLQPAGDPDASALLPEGHGDLLILTRFFNPTEAHLLCGFLVSEGLAAYVADAHLVQANPFLAPALGGVRVLVPESHFGQARQLLDRFNKGEFALSEDMDVGEPGPDRP